MNKKTEKIIKQALLLLEKNAHLSAHKLALKERHINRRDRAISLLCDLVGLTREGLEDLVTISQPEETKRLWIKTYQ